MQNTSGFIKLVRSRGYRTGDSLKGRIKKEIQTYTSRYFHGRKTILHVTPVVRATDKLR